jgi:hypothetical protein
VRKLWLLRTKLVITSIEEELDNMLNDDPLAKTLMAILQEAERL